MAFKSPGFSQLRNSYAGGNLGLSKGGEGVYEKHPLQHEVPYGLSYGETVHDKFHPYGMDNVVRDTFPTYVGTESPAYWFFETKPSGYEEMGVHANQYLNKFKTMDLLFSSPGAGLPSRGLPMEGDAKWGSWRKPNVNLAKIAVMPQVILFPKSSEFKFSYSHELSSAWGKLSDSTGLKKVSDVLEFGRVLSGNSEINTGGRMVSAYEKVPLWKSSSPIKFDGSLEFEFQFGKYGLFMAEHEVVRPILALASMWANTRSGFYTKSIAPTAPTYFALLLQHGLRKIADDIKNAPETIKKVLSEGLIKSASDLEKNLHSTINAALVDGMKQIRSVYVRIGRMIFGPLIVKNVSFGFDFSQTDEFGFPWKGTVSFGDFEQIFYPTPDTFVNMFNGFAGTSNGYGGERVGETRLDNPADEFTLEQP